MGAKGAVEIIFKGKDVDKKTMEYTERYVLTAFLPSARTALLCSALLCSALLCSLCAVLCNIKLHYALDI